MITITPQEVALFTTFIHAHSGIALNPTKAYLLESRLGPLLEEAGVASFTDFFYNGCHSPEWTTRVIDAITTNETSFFRDQRPFELLQFKILPDIVDRLGGGHDTGSPRLRIWSAACATGQEVYSVAMVIAELLGQAVSRWNIKITGTDISDAAISRASQGLYSKYELERGLPPHLLGKYFETRGESFKIRDDLRAMAFFQKINLLTPPAGLGPFDVIFCRNVAIYFSQENRCRLFQQIARHLSPGGILIIGSTESLLGVSDSFTRHEHHNTVYFQLKPGVGQDR